MMTIKQQGGIFGRNPTFNDLTASTVDIDGGSIDGVTLGTNSAVTEAQIDNININGGTIASTSGNINISSAGGFTSLLSGGVLSFLNPANTGSARIYCGGGGSLSLAGYDVEAIRINEVADVLFFKNLRFNASGLGIDFSATSGTGTSELFDDYEEGTWTPTGCGAGAVGVYTKMGDTVFAYCEVKANSVSTDTIGGLPFTVGSGNSAIGGYFGRARFAGIFDANGNEVRIRMLGTDIKFMNNGGLSGDAAATITTAGGGIVQLAISVIYKV